MRLLRLVMLLFQQRRKQRRANSHDSINHCHTLLT
jgi:hypothetical protein